MRSSSLASALLLTLSASTAARADVHCTTANLNQRDPKTFTLLPHLTAVGETVEVACDGKVDVEHATCGALDSGLAAAVGKAMFAEWATCLLLGGDPDLEPVQVQPAEGYCYDNPWSLQTTQRRTLRLTCHAAPHDYFGCGDTASRTVFRSVAGWLHDPASFALADWAKSAVETERRHYAEQCEAEGGALAFEVTWGTMQTTTPNTRTLAYPSPTHLYSLRHALSVRCDCAEGVSLAPPSAKASAKASASVAVAVLAVVEASLAAESGE